MGSITLDAKDRKILYELDMNARESISSIAKKVGLSKEVVNYRIKQLINKGVIEGFNAIIDTSKTGYRIYRLFIKYQNVSPKREIEILNYLNQHPSIGWVSSYEGFYDLAILFWAKDIFEFRDLSDDLFTKYGQYFQEHVQSSVLRIYHFKHNYLFNTKDYYKGLIGGKIDQADLDGTDFSILQILAKDCRTTTLDIGKRLNLSPNTVKYRIKRLLENKVIIAFRTMINISSLGYQHYKVFLNLHNLTQKTRMEIVEYLRINQNVTCIKDSMGFADLEFEIHIQNVTELHETIRNLKSRFANIIKNSRSVLIYKEHRINYLPSAD